MAENREVRAAFQQREILSPTDIALVQQYEQSQDHEFDKLTLREAKELSSRLERETARLDILRTATNATRQRLRGFLMRDV